MDEIFEDRRLAIRRDIALALCGEPKTDEPPTDHFLDLADKAMNAFLAAASVDFPTLARRLHLNAPPIYTHSGERLIKELAAVRSPTDLRLLCHDAANEIGRLRGWVAIWLPQLLDARKKLASVKADNATLAASNKRLTGQNVALRRTIDDLRADLGDLRKRYRRYRFLIAKDISSRDSPAPPASRSARNRTS